MLKSTATDSEPRRDMREEILGKALEGRFEGTSFICTAQKILCYSDNEIRGKNRKFGYYMLSDH